MPIYVCTYLEHLVDELGHPLEPEGVHLEGELAPRAVEPLHLLPLEEGVHEGEREPVEQGRGDPDPSVALAPPFSE